MKIKKNILNLMIIISFLFLVSRASAQIVVVGKMTHEHNARFGENYQGTITISNQGEEQADVRIYQKDYSFQSDGKTYYDEPGTLLRTNTHWIQFSPKQAIIPPKERIAVNYTVEVPDDSTLIGTYWSMMMVEKIPETEPQQIERGVSIQVVMRYAVQIITNMGDTGIRELRFSDPEIVHEEGKRLLQINIENTGERWLRPNVWVELYTLEGASIGTYEALQQRVYPETSIKSKMDLSDVANGTYKALIIADGGGDDLFGASYTLEIEE